MHRIQFLERYVIDNFRFCVAFNDNILSLLQNFELPIHNVLTEWDTCGAPLLELCINSRKDNMTNKIGIGHNQNKITEYLIAIVDHLSAENQKSCNHCIQGLLATKNEKLMRILLDADTHRINIRDVLNILRHKIGDLNGK